MNNKDLQAAVREYYETEGLMPVRIRNLISKLTYTLYFGEGEYEKGLNKLQKWSDDHLQELWYDVQSGMLLTAPPEPEHYTDEDGEEHVHYDECVHLDREYVANALFSALVAQGGLRV